jgi:hypothetical protein
MCDSSGRKPQTYGLRAFVFNLEISRHCVRPDVQGMRLAGMAILQHPQLRAETTDAITAADKEPVNVALNVFMRIPAPETHEWNLNRSVQRCQPLLTPFTSNEKAKPDTSAPTTPGRARIASDRPPTRTALPGSPENRYDAPRIRCSSGESQMKLARWWLI